MKKLLLLLIILTGLSSFAVAQRNQAYYVFQYGYSLNMSDSLSHFNGAQKGEAIGIKRHDRINDYITMGASLQSNYWKFDEELVGSESYFSLFSIEVLYSFRFYYPERLKVLDFFAETGFGINESIIKKCIAYNEIQDKTNVNNPFRLKERDTRGSLQPVLNAGLGMHIYFSPEFIIEISSEYHIYDIKHEEDIDYFSFFNINLGLVFAINNFDEE